MDDYIEIQKLWYDNELAQLAIVCSSPIITAATKIYVTEALIDDLIHQIFALSSQRQVRTYFNRSVYGIR